ncbi:uncharacterized protein IWZ02DRAFT_299592 [Phyllosticta citriasiana]|uniref:uncharacterized protein n=1 Tax=Phyllosticta citriasiana TaxID=595635 RepID=UPI0030FD6702
MEADVENGQGTRPTEPPAAELQRMDATNQTALGTRHQLGPTAAPLCCLLSAVSGLLILLLLLLGTKSSSTTPCHHRHVMSCPVLSCPVLSCPVLSRCPMSSLFSLLRPVSPCRPLLSCCSLSLCARPNHPPPILSAKSPLRADCSGQQHGT